MDKDKRNDSSVLACCNQTSVCCTTYGLVSNLLSFVFSAVLIDLDKKFISSLNNGIIGNSIDDLCWFDSATDVDLVQIGLHITKSELAASVLILVSSLAYIGIYIYACTRAFLQQKKNSNNTDSHVQHSHATVVNPTLNAVQQPPNFMQYPPGFVQQPPNFMQYPPGFVQQPPNFMQYPPGFVQPPPSYTQEASQENYYTIDSSNAGKPSAPANARNQKQAI